MGITILAVPPLSSSCLYYTIFNEFCVFIALLIRSMAPVKRSVIPSPVLADILNEGILILSIAAYIALGLHDFYVVYRSFLLPTNTAID